MVMFWAAITVVWCSTEAVFLKKARRSNIDIVSGITNEYALKGIVQSPQQSHVGKSIDSVPGFNTTNVSCKDGSDDKVFVPGMVVGCDTAWSAQGVEGGSDACGPGYEMCPSFERAEHLGLTDELCKSNITDGKFYLSRSNITDNQSLCGCGKDGDGASYQNTTACGVYNKMLFNNTGNWTGFDMGPPSLSVFKGNLSNGGILCCRNKSLDIVWDGGLIMGGAPAPAAVGPPPVYNISVSEGHAAVPKKKKSSYLVWDGAPAGVWWALKDKVHVLDPLSPEAGTEIHFSNNSDVTMIKTGKIIEVSQALLQTHEVVKGAREEYTGTWELSGADFIIYCKGLPPLRLSTMDGTKTWVDMANNVYIGSPMPPELLSRVKAALQAALEEALGNQLTKQSEPTSYVYSGCRNPHSSDIHDFDRKVNEHGFTMSLGITIDKCFVFCASRAKDGMKYFGITRNKYCFCSPLQVGVEARDSQCNEVCNGKPSKKPSEMCGGDVGAASVYTMIDCTAPTKKELEETAKAETKQIDDSYAVFNHESCGQAEDNEAELDGSGKLSGTVAECKTKCWKAKGAGTCHGFTYDSVLSECKFVIDASSGNITKKSNLDCYWKKLDYNPA